MSRKIRCMIVEDEPLAMELLKKHIALISDLECISSCDSAVEAYSELQREKIDLIFLDINMPEMSGKQLLEVMKNRPSVILTTAYREYAIESYEWDVVDYLLKPISFPRFLKAVEKYRLSKGSELSSQVGTDVNNQSVAGYIFVQENRRKVRVVFSDIFYAESMKDYIRIYTANGNVITKMTFSDFLTKLPTDFIRIHRSYIVNRSFISAFSSSSVEVDGVEIPIGISYKSDVMKKLEQ